MPYSMNAARAVAKRQAEKAFAQQLRAEEAKREAAEDAAAERRRQAIVKYQNSSGLSLKEMALLAGLRSPNALQNMLSGRARSVSASTIVALHRAMPKLSLKALLGMEVPTSVRQTQKSPQPAQHRSA